MNYNTGLPISLFISGNAEALAGNYENIDDPTGSYRDGMYFL
ncbi:hypothetical protein [uncultured Bacteroides sp.]|jgi:hypothetical protein|nr:hypothetical protein [uncultured Bacteroides sp.]